MALRGAEPGINRSVYRDGDTIAKENVTWREPGLMPYRAVAIAFFGAMAPTHRFTDDPPYTGFASHGIRGERCLIQRG